MLSLFAGLWRRKPEPRVFAVPFVMPTLRDVTEIANRIRAAQDDKAKLKEIFDSLTTVQEQVDFLKFFGDSEIIAMGIVKDVPELLSRWPQLK